MSLMRLAPLVAVLAAPALAQDVPRGETVALFDGLTLEGWTGNTGHWTVEDGCLVGRSTADAPLERSVYLFREVEADDFVLEFEYRLQGGNSGVQYRSWQMPGGDVAGYQADMEAGPNYTGILYESNGRGIVATRGQRLHIAPDGTRTAEDGALGDPAELQQAVHADDWNRYRVVARGPLLTHEINGVRMVEVRDEERGQSMARGIFAVQLHQGPPMEVRFRDMRLTHLAREAEWIWGETAAADETRGFFHRFELERPVTLDGGLLTADNRFEAWLDGEPLARGNNWQRPAAVPRGMRLEAGVHVLTVTARNDSGDAGLAVSLPWTADDGARGAIVSTADWRTSNALPEDWPQVTDVPRSWTAAKSFGPVSAHHGPWGDVMVPRVATDASQIGVPPGFHVERVHSAQPGEGSWASFTFGADGFAYVSDERGGVHQLSFPNGFDQPPVLTPVESPVRSVQGMEWAYDALYVNSGGEADGTGGLWRLRDADGDGALETHEHLLRYRSYSEHAAHGIRLGPDGLLYLVQGNYTGLADSLDMTASPHRRWAEDELLPRIWDPRGHAHGIGAPGGVVLRTDKDGAHVTLLAGGMRNPYDLAFAPGGELFTYDADMEWDIGAPWYRAPRLVHLVPGGETGWRSGTAKWPVQYPDSLPPVLETGPSSPVGIEFGSDAHFPPEWREVLFLGDWAYGRILAARLQPDGAGWSGETVDFLQGRALPVTDLEVGPDGALWFITGGRGAQSGLYRVSWVGQTDTPPDSGTASGTVDASDASPSAPTPEAALRRRIEAGEASDAEIDAALGHPDRLVRHAARVALECLPDDASLELRARGLDSPLAQWTARLAAVRRESADDRAWVGRSLANGVAFAELADDSRWLALRCMMLLGTRAPEALIPRIADHQAVARGWFAQAIVDGDAALQRECAALQVMLGTPNLPPLLMERFRAAEYPAEKVHYALLLRLCAEGWADGDREELLQWLRAWRGQPGGLSLSGFLAQIESDLLAQLPAEEAAALRATLPAPADAVDLSASVARNFYRDWTVPDALTATRDFSGDAAEGAALFRTLSCIQCHRHSGEGGSLAPDLTGAGARFDRETLLRAILDPAAERSDQYPWTVMPEGLADTLSERELAALLAFLEGR